MLVDQGFFWLMFCAGGFLLFAGIGLMYWLMAKAQNKQYSLPDTDTWEEIVIETKTYRPKELETDNGGLESRTRRSD